MRTKDLLLACDLSFKQYVNQNTGTFSGRHAYQLLNISDLDRLINLAYSEDGGVYRHNQGERVLILLSGIFVCAWDTHRFQILDTRISTTDATEINRRFLRKVLDFEKLGQKEEQNLISKFNEILQTRRNGRN